MTRRLALYRLWRALGTAAPLAVLLSLGWVAPVLGGAPVESASGGETPAGGLISEADALFDATEEAREQRIREELESDTDGDGRVIVNLGPTAWQFVNDREADVLVFRGPRRAGKTSSAVIRLLRVAAECRPDVLPVRVACVRDSWVNLQRTVHDTLRKGHVRGWWTAEFREQETECVLNGGAVHIFFFGMDRPADANKFQSFECGVLWLEEPAPAADLASGIPAEVFAMGVSSLSQVGVPVHTILTMNPGDRRHWTTDLLGRLGQIGRDELKVRLYDAPRGENEKNIPKGYYDRLRSVLEAAGRFDLVERLVEGRTGSVRVGVSVTPDYIEAQHVAPKPLALNPTWPSFMSWDFGLTPAVTLAQQSPRGHLYVIGALETPAGQAMGIEEFVSLILRPWLARYGIKMKPTTAAQSGSTRAAPFFRFRLIGDPAGVSREASSSERSAATTLEQLLGIRFERAPVDWPSRRDSLAWALRQSIGPTRLIQLDPEETDPLQAALAGEWYYYRSASGVVSERPLKTQASHVGDAFGYLCATLYPVADTLRKIARGTEPEPSRPQRQRAHSWYGR